MEELPFIEIREVPLAYADGLGKKRVFVPEWGILWGLLF